MAVSSIFLSKTFDNGTICASEQSVIVVDAVYDALQLEFIKRGAYFLNAEEREKVRQVILTDGRLNASIVQYGLRSNPHTRRSPSHPPGCRGTLRAFFSPFFKGCAREIGLK
jgi:hypothetical protein